MATLNIQPGQNLNFTDVRDFFGRSGADNLANYVRGGDIVPAVSAGGGGSTFVDFYRSLPHARFGRGFNGADGTSNNAEHTWGIYADNADFTTNPIGLEPDTTALTVGSSYTLVFNIRDENAVDISSEYLAFEVGDRLRFERQTGTFAGNGYVFELTSTPATNNQDQQGDNPVIVSMGATVLSRVGTGLIDDQLTLGNRDILTVSRALAAGANVYDTTGGFALENLGSISHGANDQYSWPTGNSIIQGVGDIRYTPGSGTGGPTV